MIKETAKKLGLDAPRSFWLTDDATLAMMAGGCGPGWLGNFGWFDHAFGIFIKPACRVHDYEYAIGKTKKEKIKSDFRLLKNSFRIIKKKTRPGIKRFLARGQAWSYYMFVSTMGGRSFKKATID